jgi:hypothetical protein
VNVHRPGPIDDQAIHQQSTTKDLLCDTEYWASVTPILIGQKHGSKEEKGQPDGGRFLLAESIWQAQLQVINYMQRLRIQI